MNKQKQTSLNNYFIKYLFLTLCIFTITPGYSQDASGSKQTPDAILTKVHHKLNSLKTFQYSLTGEYNYPSHDYHHIATYKCYYDFSLQQKPISFKYQIEDSTYKMIYNGSEKFALNKTAKTIEIKKDPAEKAFKFLPFLYNSVITLRGALPLIIADKNAQKTVADTTINKQAYKLLTINMGKRRMKGLGDGVDILKIKSNIIYQILINPDNYLPVEILQKNDTDNDFIKTSFTNFQVKPMKPVGNSWYSNTYAQEFKPAKKQERLKPLSLGTLAPNWKLKKLTDNQSLSLSSLKGKVILVDFWEKNCGACLASVPYLIKLKKKFKNQKFELLAINLQDSKEKVERYVKKRQINYPVLLNGKNVAKRYGVDAFPTFFIINKSGKIIYSQVGFDKATILKTEKIIKKAL